MALTKPKTHPLINVLTALCFVAWAWAMIGSLQLVGHPFPGFRVETTLTVSATSDPAWNGAKAKLQQYDRLMKVDGVPLKTADDLKIYVRSKPVGTVLHYEFLREKKPMSAAVATQEFTAIDWLKSFFPLLLIGLLHLVVGTVAYAMSPVSVTARIHLLMTAVMGVFFAAGNDYDASHKLSLLYLASLPLLGSAFLHLGLVFPDVPAWLRRRPWLHLLPYLPVLLIVPYWMVIYKPVGYLANPATFDLHMSLQDSSFSWVMVGLLALIGLIVFRVIKSPTVKAKQQAKVALLGAAFAYLPGILLWVVPQLFNTVIDSSGLLVTFSFAFFVCFPISIAYAIVRHKMFDIDLVIKRTIVYTTVVAALTGVYFLTIATVTWAVDRLFGSADRSVGNMVATAIVAIAFVPVRNRTKAIIDRLFFRNQYDFRGVLSEYSKFTKENPELAAVVDKYVELVEQTMHPRHMSIMVRDPKLHHLKVYRTSGLSVFPEDFAIASNTPEVQELFQSRRTGMRPSKATTRQLSHLDALGIAFCVPLEIKGEILGMINVGQKLSELDYSAEDQSLLINMGQQLASVIRIHEMTKAEVNRARLDAELETARHIQASLLPTAAPAPDGLEVMGSSQSAYEFGGDYYDLVTLHDGQLRVAVGDVAGKGVQAAMVMAMAKSCFFNQVRTNPELPAVMTAINSMIVETIEDKKHRKTSLIYAAIDPKERVLRYTCAGHQPPHYYNAVTGQVEELPIPGSFPFGASKLAKYQEVTVRLNPGDVLVFYTDGVTEATNPEGEMLYTIADGPDGEAIVNDRLRDVLEQRHDQSANEIHRHILRAVETWVGDAPQGDDITLVVVKVA